MTTYSYERDGMKRRLISGGTAECMVYSHWRNPKEVTIFTDSKNKWEYIKYLGLVTSKNTRVYAKYSWSRRFQLAWRFNAIKLEKLPYDEFNNLCDSNLDELSRFRIASRTKWMHMLKPAQFTILRPAVEFCVLHGIQSTMTDFNSGNFLRHPETGVIYPYDVMFIPEVLEK